MAFMPCFEDLIAKQDKVASIILLHEKNIYNIHMRNSDAGQDDRAALKERFAFYYIKRSLEIGRLWMSNKKELESSAFDGGHERTSPSDVNTSFPNSSIPIHVTTVIRVEQYELQILKKLDKG
ncbi:hypothetical protein ACJX0J_039097, partial [Zea mays]